jgi:single-strand DNA-binding protein
MGLNRATIVGHLGQDFDLRYLPTNGQPVASFSVATDEAFTDKHGERQERVDWHQIVVYGKLAEICHQYLSKGRQLYVEGRLRTREYEARDNGGKRQRTEIIAGGAQFLGGRPAEARATAEVKSDLLSDDAPFYGYLQRHPGWRRRDLASGLCVERGNLSLLKDSATFFTPKIGYDTQSREKFSCGT